jgi:hypothetical protein
MTWLHFLLCTAGIYLLYYLANIFYDLSTAGRQSSENVTTNELTFTETQEPQRLEPEAGPETSEGKPPEIKNPALRSKVRQENEIIASQGLTLKNLFNSAREESFLYTKAVSF